MKLIDLLLLNGSLVVGKRKITPRFIILVLAIIVLIVLVLNRDKLIPDIETLVTSNYWKAIFAE